MAERVAGYGVGRGSARAGPSSRARLLPLAILLGGLLSAAAAPAATLVFSHFGSADPATADPDPSVENWTFQDGNGTHGPLANDQGLPAWYVYDATSAFGPEYYFQSTAPHTAAAADGWTLRATLRPNSVTDVPGCSIFVESSVGGLRYYLGFGASNGQTLYLQNVCSGAGSPVDTQTGQQAVYHTYEIAWNGATGLADLYIDGRYQAGASGWAGIATGLERVLFGANSSSDSGFGHYHRIEWETGLQACRDGLDNDGDGDIDYPADAGCGSPADPDERDPDLPCDNGLDDDLDFMVDTADPRCAATGGASESPFDSGCANGADDDGDGDIDGADAECAASGGISEWTPVNMEFDADLTLELLLGSSAQFTGQGVAPLYPGPGGLPQLAGVRLPADFLTPTTAGTTWSSQYLLTHRFHVRGNGAQTFRLIGGGVVQGGAMPVTGTWVRSDTSLFPPLQGTVPFTVSGTRGIGIGGGYITQGTAKGFVQLQGGAWQRTGSGTDRFEATPGGELQWVTPQWVRSYPPSLDATYPVSSLHVHFVPEPGVFAAFAVTAASVAVLGALRRGKRGRPGRTSG